MRFCTIISLLCVSLSHADCSDGHAVCHARVSGASWCKIESNTCHGRPDIRCECNSASVDTRSVPQSPSAAPSPSSFELNHELCIARVGAHSWCKENKYCKDGDDIYCAVESSRVPAVSSVAEPKVPALRSRQHSSSADNGREFVLWAEWPSLALGEWPEYFGRLRAFIQSNCGGFNVKRVVMRILDPEFQSERGELWQVSTRSSFFVDFMRHLPSNVEVYIYPYLLEHRSAKSWSRSMRVEVPLEATFKFVHDWNALLKDNRVASRIAGVVTDKEEGRHFINDMAHLGQYKDRYSTPGSPRLRFGLTLGYDSVGSIHGTTDQVDDFYVEMYDFYVDGIYPAVPVEAHQNGALNNPEKFSRILDERVWSPYMRQYQRYPNIIFMWSLQHRESNKCNYPLPDNTCGERVDMGSWRPDAFNEFLDEISSKHPVFSQRRHGLFQFNYVPNSWQTC